MVGRRQLHLLLWCSHELTPARDGSIGGRVILLPGQQLTVALHWSGHTRVLYRSGPAQLVDRTVAARRRWAGRLQYEGPQQDLLRRSALTLTLLDHHPTSALMATATSSLPEVIGGVRYWDYRCAWLRDAADRMGSALWD